MATLKEQYEANRAQSQGNVNSIYDNALNTQKSSLQNAYNNSMQVQNQAAADTQNLYAGANQGLARQSAQTQRSMDQFADVRNLNRQAGSQQALSLGLASRNAANAMAARQNQAMAEAERQKAMATTNYNNQVQQALANNDYRRAAALLDDYNNQAARMEKDAAILASFGDFSGYGQLYGDSTANSMRDLWLAQNPDIAYRTGAIDANRYHQMTGKWPAGYNPPTSNNGYYYGEVGGPDTGTIQLSGSGTQTARRTGVGNRYNEGHRFAGNRGNFIYYSGNSGKT